MFGWLVSGIIMIFYLFADKWGYHQDPMILIAASIFAVAGSIALAIHTK